MSTNENSGGLNNVVNQPGAHPICPFLFSLNYMRLWGVIVHFSGMSGQQNYYNLFRFLNNCEVACLEGKCQNNTRCVFFCIMQDYSGPAKPQSDPGAYYSWTMAVRSLKIMRKFI